MAAAAVELSKTRIVLMAIFIAGAYIDWGLLFSIQPPFYPSEAEKKGATPSQYGFVFGITHLSAFIFAPIFGRFGNDIGPKLLYNLGGFIQGAAGVAFGFLEYVDGTAAFLGLSYFLRFLDGASDAASWGAVLGILMKIWPDRVATIMSWTEMFFGLGYTIGPAIGSWLYSIGGFKLPFIVVGSFGLFCSINMFFLIPNLKQVDLESSDSQNDEKTELLSNGNSNGILSNGILENGSRQSTDSIEKADARSSKGSISIAGSGESITKRDLTLKDIATTPAIFMPYVDNIVCFCGYGFFESMLEPHMKDEAGATQAQVGYNFLIMGAVYMVMTPIAGYISDHTRHPVMLGVCGNVFMAVATLMVGPAPFFDAQPTVPLILGSAAVVGFAYSQIMVSTFARANSAAMSRGYRDDIKTYLLISGMWASSFYLGNFLGPTAAGILVDYIGFRRTSMVFFVLYLVMAVVDSVDLARSCVSVRKAKREGYLQME